MNCSFTYETHTIYEAGNFRTAYQVVFLKAQSGIFSLNLGAAEQEIVI